MKDGNNMPSIETNAPLIPLSVYPIYMMTLNATGPGNTEANEIPSNITSSVISLFLPDNFFWTTEINAIKPPNEVAPIFKKE